MLNTIRNKLIDWLTPSYRLIKVKTLTKEERKYIASNDHKEFLSILFRAMAERVNQNSSVLIKGQYRSERECGNYQGAIRALSDIIELTSKLADSEAKNKSYEDIIKKIVEDSENNV